MPRRLAHRLALGCLLLAGGARCSSTTGASVEDAAGGDGGAGGGGSGGSGLGGSGLGGSGAGGSGAGGSGAGGSGLGGSGAGDAGVGGAGSGGSGAGGRGTGGRGSGGADGNGTGPGGNLGQTGGAGGAAYSPCPALPAPCKILPFGDSITFGVGSNGADSNGGYRVELFHRALVDHKTITLVGTAAPNGPTTVDGVTFPRAHEGHSGYTIDDKPLTTTPARNGIAPLAATVLPATRPDIVLLLIGTNDVQIPYDPANAPSRLASLVDAILAFDAHTLLVVGQIIPTTDPAVNPGAESYNAAISSLVATRAASGKHIAVVDLYHPIANAPGFVTPGRTLPAGSGGPMFDWLHPNVAGYVLIGDAWYEGIKASLR